MAQPGSKTYGRGTGRAFAHLVAILVVLLLPLQAAAQDSRKGRIEILNSRTGQLLPLGVALLEDTERNAARLDVLGAASRLRVPYLVVHGTDDESVSVADGVRLAESGPADSTRLQLIEGAGHTFGAVHPFQGTTGHLTQAIELTAGWFTDNLGD